ncbi:MAG: glycosyltransferase family 4 protein [Lachnospiraceae bacterium]|nr:glycosyltransferase family 4 protein [Lachnospiraceae bacterium]
MTRPRVLMAGPGRDVRGGVSAVVNGYYALGIEDRMELTYLTTMEDGSKWHKAAVFAGAYLRFPALMHKADILHVHLSPRASFARKALLVERAFRMGKRIIIHQHGGDFGNFYYRESDAKKQARIRSIFGMADRVIVLSEEWRDFFADGICDPQKMIVLHNGVVLSGQAAADYGSHRILTLGKLWEAKGVYELLAAIPTVVGRFPDAYFYLCGDGDLEKCRQIVRDDGMEEHVRFPGWIDEEERGKLFSSCSIFLLPSHFEGMPMSLLEAMGHGLACIATSVGGIPQIITDGESGLLIPPRDENAISGSLIRLLGDESLRRRLGTEGACVIRADFDAAAGLNRLLDIYRELTDSPGGTGAG